MEMPSIPPKEGGERFFVCSEGFKDRASRLSKSFHKLVQMMEKAAQKNLNGEGCTDEWFMENRNMVFQELNMILAYLDPARVNQGGSISDCQYSSYTQPHALIDQCIALQKAFPKLGNPNPTWFNGVADGKFKLPKPCEGWFAIPNWEACPWIFGESHKRAVGVALEALAKVRGDICLRGGFSLDQLSRLQGVSQYWHYLSGLQDHAEILLVPAQFGYRHLGRCPRGACEVMEVTEGEFPLGLFEVTSMLITHRARVNQENDLMPECAGDRCILAGEGNEKVPCFTFHKGKLSLGAKRCSEVKPPHCAPSGFVLYS